MKVLMWFLVWFALYHYEYLRRFDHPPDRQVHFSQLLSREGSVVTESLARNTIGEIRYYCDPNGSLQSVEYFFSGWDEQGEERSEDALALLEGRRVFPGDPLWQEWQARYEQARKSLKRN